MCGRINVSDHPGVQALLDFLDIPIYPEKFIARYNIAPGAQLYSAFANQSRIDGAFTEWGIIPNWAKPGKFSRPLINARAETIWEKPSFRNLVKTNRVIIPISGFYEWRRSNNEKIPFHIHASDEKALAIGGIYQVSNDGVMQSCIVTTSANKSMAEVHDRMPVILSPESMKDWLHSEDKVQLDSLMQPTPNNWIKIEEVSPYVNSTRNDGPACIESPGKNKTGKLF